ncbi:hypothetical protein MRY87_11030 [bacterium]|nr:hypothetical protein [bacterium]
MVLHWRLFLPLLLLPLSLGAQPLAPRDVTVTVPQGAQGRVLFAAQSLDNTSSQIFLADLRTKRLAVLFPSRDFDTSPVFHPNGMLFAFVSDRPLPAPPPPLEGEEPQEEAPPEKQRKRLYVGQWNGKELSLVPTGGTGAVGNPDWDRDPEQQKLYYYKEEGGPRKTSLYSYDLVTKRETRISKHPSRNTTPKVSPDGSTLAFSTNRSWPGWDVCLFNMQRKSLGCPLKGIESFCRPNWSASGEHLFYSSGSGRAIGLYQLEFASDTRTELVAPDSRSYDVILGGANHLLYANDRLGSFDIYRLSLEKKPKKGEKTKPEPLLSAPFHLRYPSWHPASSMEQEVQRFKASNE